MTQQDRLHRPEPKRTQPIRNRTAYLRKSLSWGDAGPDNDYEVEETGRLTDNCDDILTHGVNLGYKIIDEHILQGKQVAQNLRNRSHFKEGKGSELGELNALVTRLVGLTKDMGALCMDSVELAIKSPKLLTSGFQTHGANEPVTPKRALSTGTQFSLEIASAKRTQVSLNLTGQHPVQHLQIHALHPANPAFPPLTGVSFKGLNAAKQPVLVVEIPPNQGASTYTGVVVEKDSNEPVGTIVIKVLS